MFRSLLSLFTFLLLVFFTHLAAAETIVLPISIDYPFLRSLALSQLFTGPGHAAVIVNEFDGCQFLELRDPQFKSENGLLLVKAGISIRGGIPAFDKCVMPVEWKGYVEVVQKITVGMPGWGLRVETVDSRYRNLDGEQTILNEFLWNLIKDRLHGHLDQMFISLVPPLREIESLLPLFYSSKDQARVAAWIGSLRPGVVWVLPEGIRAEVLMDVEEAVGASVPLEAEKQLSPEELDRFLRSWEDFDAFLSLQIRSMASYALSDTERAEVLEILLQTRYQIAVELAAVQPRLGADLVRRQFVTTWERLAPIFRRHFVHDSAASQLSYLVYLSAGDALAALDRLGPSLGLEVSRNGLIRLARLLVSEGGPVKLAYTFEVDPELRRIMGLGPEPVASGPGFTGEETELEKMRGVSGKGSMDWKEHASLLGFLVRPVYAAESELADLQALRAWLVDQKNFDDYLQMARATLRAACEKVLVAGSPLAGRQELFVSLMDATAWQESCFRQFTNKQGKLTYVRSWNNSSVGLLQINERVWRGFYRIDALRWDPAYNMQAGIEIMHTYISRYVLNGPGERLERLDDDTLVRIAYAMYNGGPGQYKALLDRQAAQTYYQSDLLFWEKYTMSRAGDFQQLRYCLFGK